MKANGSLTSWWLVNGRPLRNIPTWHCLALRYLIFALPQAFSTLSIQFPLNPLGFRGWFYESIHGYSSASFLPHSYHLPPLPSLSSLSSDGIFRRMACFGDCAKRVGILTSYSGQVSHLLLNTYEFWASGWLSCLSSL